MSMEASLFSVKPLDETAALVDTLFKALQRTQLSHVQTPDLKKLWDNTYVLFWSAWYTVTWYTACKTNVGMYASYGVLHIQCMGELSQILCTERKRSSWSQFFQPHDNNLDHGLSPLLRGDQNPGSEYEVRVANDREASRLSCHLQHLDFTADVSGEKIKVEYLKGQRTQAWFCPSS